MKTTFTLSAFIISLSFSAEAQDYKVQWGPEYKKEEMTEYLPWLGYNDKYIFKIARTRSDKYILSNFDYKLNKLSEVELDIESFGKEAWFYDMFSFQSKCWIIIKNKLPKENLLETYAIELGADGKQGTPKKIASVYFDFKGGKKKNTDTFGFSFNGSFISMLQGTSNDQIEGPDKFILHMFDTDFNKLWERELTFKYSDEVFYAQSRFLTEKGDLFLKAWLKVPGTEGKEKWESLFVKVNKTEMEEYPVERPQKGILIVAHNIFEVLDDAIVMGGTYKTEDTPEEEIEGVFFQKYDLSSKEIVIFKSYEHRSSAFTLHNLVKRANGYCLVIHKEGANKYLERQADGTNRQITTYFSSELLIPKFSYDGDLEWVAEIDKNSSWDRKAYTGYFFEHDDDKMWFLFNDGKDRKELIADDVKGKYFNPVVADLSIIDNEGKETYRKMLFDSEEMTGTSKVFAPTICLSLKDNSIVIYQEVLTLLKDNYRFGILAPP